MDLCLIFTTYMHLLLKLGLDPYFFPSLASCILATTSPKHCWEGGSLVSTSAEKEEALISIWILFLILQPAQHMSN